MVKKTFFISVGILLGIFLFSQQAASVMDQILVITIDANVSGHSGERIWGMEHSTLTISGRSVHIKLEGSNLEILANLTPYEQEDENVLLVAQGDIWITGTGEERRQHYSGMDSVTVKLGQNALFFPLGIAEGKIQENFILAIEIGVDLYTNLQKKSTKR